MMRKILDWFLRPHPAERGQSVWLQEEARAERLANLLRVIYMLTWVPVVISIARDHPPSANVVNIGGGLTYLVLTGLYVIYLRARPYRPAFKYASTTLEVLLTTSNLFVYHYEMGYSTSLKAPPFMNYLAMLVLTVLRFNTILPLYAGALAILTYSGLFAYLVLTQDVEFGTPLELFTTPKINLVYQVLRLIYLALFATVGSLIAQGVQRLVRLRVQETEKALVEKAQRERTQDLFERYFTPEIARYLTEHPQEMGGKTLWVTLLLTDLRGFTALSERLGPAESVDLLNTVFESLVGTVFKYGGTLDKFVGDGMLVVFGVPSPQPDDALRAVRAAREMLENVPGLGHRLEMGIALHTGEVIFGNVGSAKRMELTVIGDPVNTTSRMEALNKEFGTQIILSEATYQEIRDHVEVRELPPWKLRGKTEEMKFYTLPEATDQSNHV